MAKTYKSVGLNAYEMTKLRWLADVMGVYQTQVLRAALWILEKQARQQVDGGSFVLTDADGNSQDIEIIGITPEDLQ